VNFFNDTVQWAGWNATTEHTDTLKTYYCPILIEQKIKEERRLRRGWQRLRTPESKRLLNKATQELKQLLNRNKNDCIQTFLQGLTPTESTYYSHVKGGQENKTDQETFSTTYDITRNLGRKQRW
jgi:hypothetical protein